MGARCLVCVHDHRADIELGLSRKVGLDTLARRYGISKSSLSRHSTNHLPPALKGAMHATGRAVDVTDLEHLRQQESENLLTNSVAFRARLFRQLDAAEESGDLRAAAAIDGRILSSLEFVGKLLGELTTHSTTTVNQLLIAPEYLNFRAAVLRALRDYPAARMAVAAVIHELEGAPPVITGSPRSKAVVIDQEAS